LGVLAGALITVQSVLNASLGDRAGVLGSVMALTIVSFVVLVVLIFLFPNAANFRGLPGLSRWYLYLGGALGVIILVSTIFLVPKIGAAETLTAIVVGQLTLAVVVDHFGLLSVPRVEVSLLRVAGIALVAVGAYLVVR
ncbi:MAG: DMT family transporter, partial [Candidatus Promineifilaceae bacterium]